jgi:hypothetical protein
LEHEAAAGACPAGPCPAGACAAAVDAQAKPPGRLGALGGARCPAPSPASLRHPTAVPAAPSPASSHPAPPLQPGRPRSNTAALSPRSIEAAPASPLRPATEPGPALRFHPRSPRSTGSACAPAA